MLAGVLVAVVLLAIGFPLIAKASGQFVVGASRVSRLLGISPMVIGAVVVGFGTSAPEMVVAGLAVLEGSTDLGVGQVLGSNIANFTLVLGVAALVVPVNIARRTIRREYLLSASACVVFVVLAVTETLNALSGLVLLVMLVGALVTIVRWGQHTPVEMIAGVDPVAPRGGSADEPDRPTTGAEIVRTVTAMVGVVVAAQMLVSGAGTVAEELGVPQVLIGFTLVALGTSLPELVTAVSAARKGHTDLIIGNVLGSNLFNSLGVGAVIGLVGPSPLDDPELAVRSGLALVAVVIVVGLFMRSRPGVVRWEGAVLVAGYLGVVGALLL